jgi:hypothetical protein
MTPAMMDMAKNHTAEAEKARLLAPTPAGMCTDAMRALGRCDVNTPVAMPRTHATTRPTYDLAKDEGKNHHDASTRRPVVGTHATARDTSAFRPVVGTHATTRDTSAFRPVVGIHATARATHDHPAPTAHTSVPCLAVPTQKEAETIFHMVDGNNDNTVTGAELEAAGSHLMDFANKSGMNFDPALLKGIHDATAKYLEDHQGKLTMA